MVSPIFIALFGLISAEIPDVRTDPLSMRKLMSL